MMPEPQSHRLGAPFSQPVPTPEQEMDALVSEIRDARDEIREALSKLSSASQRLKAKLRGNTSSEIAGSFMLFANAHIRCAAALTQGLQRTGLTDRMLARGRENQKEEKALEELRQRATAVHEAKKKAQQRVDNLLAPTVDAFDVIYGDVVDQDDEVIL